VLERPKASFSDRLHSRITHLSHRFASRYIGDVEEASLSFDEIRCRSARAKFYLSSVAIYRDEAVKELYGHTPLRHLRKLGYGQSIREAGEQIELKHLNNVSTEQSREGLNGAGRVEERIGPLRRLILSDEKKLSRREVHKILKRSAKEFKNLSRNQQIRFVGYADFSPHSPGSVSGKIAKSTLLNFAVEGVRESISIGVGALAGYGLYRLSGGLDLTEIIPQLPLFPYIVADLIYLPTLPFVFFRTAEMVEKTGICRYFTATIANMLYRDKSVVERFYLTSLNCIWWPLGKESLYHSSLMLPYVLKLLGIDVGSDMTTIVPWFFLANSGISTYLNFVEMSRYKKYSRNHFLSARRIREGD
jgi:hypothetical protein